MQPIWLAWFRKKNGKWTVANSWNISNRKMCGMFRINFEIMHGLYYGSEFEYKINWCGLKYRKITIEMYVYHSCLVD